jgi:hypothetical protein
MLSVPEPNASVTNDDLLAAVPGGEPRFDDAWQVSPGVFAATPKCALQILSASSAAVGIAGVEPWLDWAFPSS